MSYRCCTGVACLATALGILNVQVAHAGPRNLKKALDMTAIPVPADQADGPVSHGPGTIITGFEPPFVVGSMDNQQGWPTSGVGLPWASISNVAPDNLLQHLRMIDDPTVADGTQRLIFSPNLGPQTVAPHIFECRIKISNDGGADYWLNGQAPTQGFITWRVIFSFEGATAGSPGTIVVVENAGAGFAAIDTGVAWTENQYKTFRLEYTPNGQGLYFYDGVLIYTDVDTGNNAIGTTCEQLVFLHDNFQLANELCDMDLVSLTPGAATDGACCAPDGTCSITTPAACVAPNLFRGLGTTCGAGTCVGKCCQPDGFCAVVPSGNCVGAGFVFAGVGTVCGAVDECLGRCCMPDGSCLADGPQPCVANGGTFGGIGVQCGDGSLCRGRCCVGVVTCIPDSSPNSCAVAGGTLTLGANCQASTDATFTLAPALAIPDGVGGGGLGTLLSNVQNVAGVAGNISDLNVDVKIDHSWMGDIVVAIEHLGTSVTVVDLMGHAAIDCAGCASNNIDVILDDEVTGGAIEDQCVAANQAAISPPNFTPANPLTAFDGMDPNGAWTIKVQDACGVDTGSLVRWSLHFALPTSPCAPSCTCKGDMNGSGTVNGADINKFAQCVASGGGAGCACADINGGGITAADVTPFVNALIAGTACIP